MVSSSVQTVKLAVQHVRKRRQWMPVVEVQVREGPDQAIQTQAASDDRIFIDILVIVKVDEVMMQGLAEYRPNAKPEGETDRKR